VSTDNVDVELRTLVGSIQGRIVAPIRRSFHLHQLDGARMEAMVYLEPDGARVDWVHGKGDCALTGEGLAMLEVLTGRVAPEAMAAAGRLSLYGDDALIRRAAEVFRPGNEPRL
jgi:hypothetical protein